MPDIQQKLNALTRAQEERHTEELAKKLNLPYIDLLGYPLVEEILNIIPEELAIEHQIIPYLKVGKSVKIGIIDPSKKESNDYLDKLARSAGIVFVKTVISETSFYYGISIYEKIRKEKQSKEEVKVEEKKNFEEEINDLKSASEALKKANTTKLLDLIVTGAYKTKSSDIHLEPRETDFLIRYRIDGILQDVVTLPQTQFKQLVSRIKYLAKLRMDIIDEPQDGRITMNLPESNEIDLRISIMPSTWGESIVIRLLGQEKSILSLDKLGIRPDALVAIREAISKPYGMILTSGPTGSGKSTTLYAILMELHKPGIKIITLENPVEYRIEGIEQSQVKPGAGYEFVDGLRASLRQDPDVLMVGEIRDAETAEIAVQASLTGHLMISTIHANSAPAVFARLIEIGVKPFLLSGSINLIMAQRLVRKICQNCRETYSPRPEIWQEVKKVLLPIKDRLNQKYQDIISSENLPTLIHGKGCEACNKSGFLGRQQIIEVLVPDDEIESLIAKKGTIAEFEKIAAQKGMITMEQDGLIKALQGFTTIEEVWRVTKN